VLLFDVVRLLVYAPKMQMPENYLNAFQRL
jgi:hypothetical protein